MIAFWDALAAAVAAPEVVNLVWGVAVARAGARVNDTPHGRFFRWLDRILDGRLQQLSWLAVDYLLVRAVLWAWQSPGVPRLAAATATLAAAAAAVISGFALMVPYSTFIAPFCERRSLGIDKGRHFPGHAALEAAWRDVRDEFWHATRGGKPLPQMADIFPDNGLVYATGCEAAVEARWDVLFLRAAGRDMEKNLARFPRLKALVDHPEVVTVLFSVLPPGVALRPHRGYYKGVLRYHLALEVPEPEQTWLEVGGERYHWAEGEGVLFDDLALHSVHNHGTRRRVVLFLDITRRLPGPLNAVNRLATWLTRRHPLAGLIEKRGSAWGTEEIAAS